MKNSYIVRRDNKESTALSFEQLQEIGLRETDLIWVECQSMDWRSPFEIAELKNLVSADCADSKKDNTGKSASQERPNYGNLSKNQPYLKRLEKYSHPGHVSISKLEKTPGELQANSGSPTKLINAAQIENAQGVRRNKSILTVHLPKRVKKIALYTGLIMTGALLMLLVENLGGKESPEAAQKEALPAKNAVSPPAQPELQNDTGKITEANILSPGMLKENNSDITAGEQKKIFTHSNRIPLKTNATAETPDSTTDKIEKNTNPVAEIKVKPVTIADISPKIDLKANDYNVGAFGGIRNLKMTLQNGSAYLLDKVTVELKYVNPDGNIIKTEQLYFQNVPPQNATTIKVDKSKRGVKVEYNITNIECKALANPQQVLAGPGH